jgi:hypothetical protein
MAAFEGIYSDQPCRRNVTSLPKVLMFHLIMFEKHSVFDDSKFENCFFQDILLRKCVGSSQRIFC